MTTDPVAQRQADKELIDAMASKQTPEMDDLVTIARLRMRYNEGPLRRHLDQQLLRWDISEEALHQLCREHWANYQHTNAVSVQYGSGADTE